MSKQPQWKRAVAWTAGFLMSSAGAFLLSLIFTFAMLHGYILPLTALPYSEGIKGQDSYQMVWNLWFAEESITSGQSPYRTDLLYYPLGARLSHHSLSPGYFLLTLSIKILSRDDAMYPFMAYRMSVLLSFTLILYFSFLALHALAFRGWATVIPAVAYAFGAYYMEHLLHLNQIAGFFIPLTAFCLIRSFQRPNTGRLVITAVIAAAAIYFTELSLYIYMAFVLVILLMCTFSAGRRALLERIRLAGVWPIVVSLSIFALVIAPFLIEFFALRSMKPRVNESLLYSGSLLGFFLPASGHAIYGQLGAPGLGEAFVGFPVLLLAGIALVKCKDRVVRLSVLAALFFFLLSLGPSLKILHVDTGIPLPYAALMKLPPFDLSRGPVRFVVMASFFLMIAAAGGATWLEQKLKSRCGASCGTVAMAALFIWVIAESHVSAPRQEVVTEPRGLSEIIAGPVLNLPLILNDGYSEVLQIFHRQPIATGFLARYTPEQYRQFAYLKRLFDEGGSEFCNGVRAMGFQNIIIAPTNIVPNAPSVAPLELAQCAINVVDLRTGGRYSFRTVESPESFPNYEPGTEIDLRKQESDQFLWYGWSGREDTHRWTDRKRAALVFALNELQPLILLTKLGPFIVPGRVEKQRLQLGINGHHITEVTLTGSPQEYSFSIPKEFLEERNVLTLDLPDAESPSSFGLGDDARLLGVRLEWLKIDSDPQPGPLPAPR